MDATLRTESPHRQGKTVSPGLRLAAIAVAAALAASLAVSGCGSIQNQAELPDLATKSPKSAANQNVLTSAQQKRAIDEMVARRAEQERAAREAAGR